MEGGGVYQITNGQGATVLRPGVVQAAPGLVHAAPGIVQAAPGMTVLNPGTLVGTGRRTYINQRLPFVGTGTLTFNTQDIAWTLPAQRQQIIFLNEDESAERERPRHYNHYHGANGVPYSYNMARERHHFHGHPGHLMAHSYPPYPVGQQVIVPQSQSQPQDNFNVHGILEYGRLTTVFPESNFTTLPDFIQQELQRAYGQYSRTEVNIEAINGQYTIRGKPKEPVVRTVQIPRRVVPRVSPRTRYVQVHVPAPHSSKTASSDEERTRELPASSQTKQRAPTIEQKEA
ncbi:Hypp2009 [Branchiostoma lanceolatum]|uniref:Hypp2009 protein n=1 Tax=Branchiostoma lanceolatum TaxID=7740 RepID=A0A8J9ZQU2_BRALA|nr:Hypp2009 [Branchiostoma lanceolatum]